MSDNIFAPAPAPSAGDGGPNMFAQPAVAAARAVALTPAEAAARAEAAAKELGWPTAAVQRDQDGAAAALTSQRTAQALQGAPALAKWAADPANVAVSHDILGSMSGVDRGINEFFGGVATSVGRAIGGVGEAADAGERLMFGGRPLPKRESAAQTFAPVSSYLKAKGAELTPAHGNLIEQGLTLAGSVLPYLNPFGLIVMGAQGADASADQARKAGKYGTTAGDVGTVLNTATQAALGAVPFHMIGDLVPKVASPVINAVTHYLAGTTAAATTGAAMQTGENAITKATVNPEQDLTEGVADSAKTMGAFHTAAHVVGAIGGIRRDTEAAIRAPVVGQSFDGIVQAVRSSPLLARSPERLQSFLEEAAPAGRVFVPADAVRTYLQADGDIGPFERAGVGDQVAAALTSGSDVVVPAADFLTHIGPTPTYDALKDDLRFGLNDMSPREARSYGDDFEQMLQQKGDDLAAQTRAIEEAAAPGQRVFDAAFSQHREAYSNDAARQHAITLMARYETRAARLNEGAPDDLPDGLRRDAWSEFQRGPEGHGTRVQLELPEAVRSHFDRLDTVIHALREERKPDAKRGDSLLDFVSKNGGVTDPKGELAAMDGHLWHVPKENGGVRFRRKLIRQDGLSDDDMALKAQEAGYFPDAAERVEGAHLHEAAREELQGRPRYANAIDQQRSDFRDAVDGLDRVLSERGIDVTKASNAEIKAALTQEAEGGRSYEQGGRFSQSFTARMADEHPDVKLDLADNGVTATLSRIVVPEGDRGRGVGSRIMSELAAEADREGVRLALTPDGTFGGSPPRLRAFYKRFGFVENKGRDRSFTTRETMVRNPPGRTYYQAARVSGTELAPAGSPIQDLRAAAERFFKEKLVGTSVRSAALGRDVKFTHKAWKKARSASADPRKLQVVPILRDLIARGRLVETQAPYRSERDVVAYHTLDAIADIAGEPSKVRITVRELKNGDLYYDHRIDDEGPAPKGDGASQSAQRAEDKPRSGEPGAEAPTVKIEPLGEADKRTLDQAARGSVSFGDGPAIIRLFEGRDLSTAVHEWSHVFLEELRADARLPDAPESVRRDWETALHELGISDLQDHEPIPTDAHETWARSFEAYVQDGKAPSERLRGAFQRFKAWLLTIYRHVRELNVTVSPELRDVFDRLLATDDEIKRARETSGLKLADPTALGMSDAEAGAYRDLAAKATGEASDALLQKVMGEVRRKRTVEWEEQRERALADAEESVSASAAIHALDRLTGRGGERVKLSARDVADIYGSETVVDQLPRMVPPVYSKEGGVHPDVLGDELGYGSGEEMLNELMRREADRRERVAAGDPRSIRRFAIDTEADRLMAERHGDMLTDGSIQEEALAVIHGERAGEVLAAELKALSRKTGEQAAPLKMVEDWAQRFIADRAYGDLQPHVYLRAEAKAARAAEKALIARDDVAALEAKQRQLISHILFREAKRAQDASDKIVDRLAGLAKRKTLKSMAQDYLDQIHDLIERFDFRPASRRELSRRVSLSDFLRERAKDGEAVMVPQRLADDAQRTHYSRMSVSDLQGLGDTVANLAHLGRLKKTLLVGKGRRDFDAMLSEIEGVAGGLKDRKEEAAADEVERKNLARDLLASHTKVETMVNWLDGRDPEGPLHRALIQPAQDAHVEANEFRKLVLEPIGDAYDATPREVRRSWRRKIDNAELIDPKTARPLVMDKRAVLAIMLNKGNASNWTKLLEGWGWDEAATNRLVDRVATKADWDFVQSVWTAIDKLWPHIAEREKRLQGVEPERVQALSVQTPHGTYEGGYYPLVYDVTRSSAARDQKREEAADLFSALHVSASTSAGHTKARTGFKAPVLLSPEAVIFDHVNKVTTRLAYGEFVASAKKLIDSPRFARLVEQKISRQDYAQFERWLQAQVGYRLIDPRALHGVDAFFRQARLNFSTATAAVNPVVWFEHAAAYPQSVLVLSEGRSVAEGLRWWGEGMMRWASKGGPLMASDFIYSRSKMMAQRMEETSRDARDVVDALHRHQSLAQRAEDATGLPVAWLDRIPALAHWPVSYINQHVVAFPTWLGGYYKALHGGKTEEEAIRFADKMVRSSHASGAPMNLSAIQNPNNEFMKLGTMFYSYHNTMGQFQRDLAFQAGSTKSAAQAGTVFAQGLILAFVIPIISGIARGAYRGDTSPEEFAETTADEVARSIWAPFAFGRDFLNAGLNAAEGKPIDFDLSPLGRAVEESLQFLKDGTRMAGKAAPAPVAHVLNPEGKDPSEAWIKHLGNTAGAVTGWPVGSIARSVQYEHDVHTGKEQPANAGEHALGLLFGSQPQRRH